MSETKKDDSKISAAILGMFAAIKICRAEGYSPKQMVDLLLMVEKTCDEWGILPDLAIRKDGE